MLKYIDVLCSFQTRRDCGQDFSWGGNVSLCISGISLYRKGFIKRNNNRLGQNAK